MWPGSLTMLKVPTGRDPSTQSAMSRQSTYCSGRSYGPGAGTRPPAAIRLSQNGIRPTISYGPRMSPARAIADVAVELRQHGELAAALGRGVVGAVGRRRVALDDRRALVGARRAIGHV